MYSGVDASTKTTKQHVWVRFDLPACRLGLTCSKCGSGVHATWKRVGGEGVGAAGRIWADCADMHGQPTWPLRRPAAVSQCEGSLCEESLCEESLCEGSLCEGSLRHPAPGPPVPVWASRLDVVGNPIEKTGSARPQRV
eukprot:366008-Chlamydomonas_euryale.AAC.11